MMQTDTGVPWESEECFPEKPVGQDYGYLERGKFVGCTREQLIARCSGMELPDVELVWHPGSPRLVPVMTVDFLLDSLRIREKAVLRQNMRVAGFNVLVFLVCGLVVLKHGENLSNGYFILVVCFGVLFGVWPMWDSWKDLRNFDKMKWDTSAAATAFDRYAAWVGTRSSRVTWLIMGAIALVGLAQVIVSTNSIYQAGLVKQAVLKNGQWWRLATAPFLHGGLIHFVFNASALIGLGRLAEALAGGRRVAIVFAFSALGGGILSLFFLPHSTSVGASGGLLGLIGFLLVLGWRRKTILPPGFVRIFVINVILVAVMGAVAYSVVDNAAHFGGFLCGVASGLIMVKTNSRMPLPATVWSKMLGILSISLIILSALFATCKILGKI